MQKPIERIRKYKKTFAGSTLAATLVAAAIAIGLVGSASAADLVDIEIPLDRNKLERSLETAELRDDYRKVYANAEKLDVAPKLNAARTEDAPVRLERKLKQLRGEVKKARKAKKKANEKANAEPKVGSPDSVGVSMATLESIAACESGGDPAAVSSTGAYRGKYQFHPSTWASVGGSGDPAAAPEAEQDYRAAILYSRSGSSPWPVCGS